MNEVYEFLKKCNTYYLATQEEGQPRVRPFGTVLIFEDRLYIHTGKRKAVSAQLHADPRAEICAFDGSSWLRLSGELEADDRIAPKKAMLDAYPSLRAMYDENDDNTEVFFFINARAVFSGFGKEDRELLL